MNEYSLDLTALGVFNGYYETFWDDRYTMAVERLEMELMEQFGEKIDFDYKLDYPQIEYEVGTAFAGWFENEFDNHAGEGSTIVFYSHTWSPSFYNYDTDHLILRVDSELSENEFDKLVSEAVDSFHEEFDDAVDGSGVWFTDSWYCNYEEIIYNNITEVTVNGEAVELNEDRWEFVSKEKDSKQLALI